MRATTIAVAIGCTLLFTGCVTKGTHTQTLTDLEQTRKASAQTAAAFESYKKQATAEIEGLKQERTNLSNDLLAALTTTNKQQQLLDTATETLTSELGAKRELEGEVKRLHDVSQQVQRVSGELRRERDLLLAKVGELERQIAQAADLTKGLEARDQEIGKLQASIAQEKERLKAEEAEKARLEQERAAKEAEIERLTKTHEDLTKSLQAEIAKGDIKIKQVRDRLTINMVDRVLFDSGQAQVKPTGLKVLKQVSDILKQVTDKQIRIEGHTDNVPIGARLKDRFPTNWELSTARATSVVRYLIEDGGVDRANLSAVGYAENRPVAGNDAEEGRTANRRIEIVLYPKDLSEIAGQIRP